MWETAAACPTRDGTERAPASTGAAASALGTHCSIHRRGITTSWCTMKAFLYALPRGGKVDPCLVKKGRWEGDFQKHCENHIASAVRGTPCMITQCGAGIWINWAAKKFLKGVMSRGGSLRVSRVLLELL